MIDLVERSAVYQRLTNKTRMGNPKSPDDILTNLVNVTFVSWAFVSQVITKKTQVIQKTVSSSLLNSCSYPLGISFGLTRLHTAEENCPRRVS